MEEAGEYQAGIETQEVVPIDQDVIMFYGRPIMVVRLPDGQPAVVIRSLCENMQLDRAAQVRRIQRTAPIAQDLLGAVRIETDGGPQRVQVLILRSVPYWLTGIDHKRVRPEMQEEVLRYQCEAVDALYTWAQHPRELPDASNQIIPAEPPSPDITAIDKQGPSDTLIIPMEKPSPEATHHEKATYHEMMSLWHRYQADMHMQQWRSEVEEVRGGMESRVESLEEVVRAVLPRLGLSAEHQSTARAMVEEIWKVSGTPRQAIYFELNQAFQTAKYADIPDERWRDVAGWLKRRLDTVRGERGTQH